jgi:hypothetical protein
MVRDQQRGRLDVRNVDQSDYQIMPSGGRITGILSGEFGVILQRNRICRMDYVGGNTIFEINEVSSNIGCVSVHTVAQWGGSASSGPTRGR